MRPIKNLQFREVLDIIQTELRTTLPFFTPTMNYIILKTIIDSTIQNYNQTNPTQTVTENNVSIINMTAKGIDILIRCPHTHKDIRIHAEVNFMN